MKNKLFITILSAFLALSAISMGVYASIENAEAAESTEIEISNEAPAEDAPSEEAPAEEEGKGKGKGKGNKADKFVDEDGDGVCDNFVDEDADGICDNKPAKGNKGKGKNK